MGKRSGRKVGGRPQPNLTRKSAEPSFRQLQKYFWKDRGLWSMYRSLSNGGRIQKSNNSNPSGAHYGSMRRSRMSRAFNNIPDRLCDGSYIVYPNQPLGRGSFGVIYDGFNTKLGIPCAVKFETMGQPDPQLTNEAKLYRTLWEEGVIGIPRIFYWGVEENFTVLVLEKLGPSLEDLFTFCGRKFSFKTVLILADQIISRFEYIHGRDFLHRDVKPENFVMGVGPKAHHVYLLDFGLAKKYRVEKKHIRKSVYESLTGTVRYTSINSHNGITQSRRDDLESVGYILVYFSKGGLPWQGLPARTKRKKYQKIRKKKIETGISSLCKGLPACFTKYFKYVRSLKFEETPDYDHMRKIFRREFIKREFVLDFVYDWNERYSELHSADRIHSYVTGGETINQPLPSPSSLPRPPRVDEDDTPGDGPSIQILTEEEVKISQKRRRQNSGDKGVDRTMLSSADNARMRRVPSPKRNLRDTTHLADGGGDWRKRRKRKKSSGRRLFGDDNNSR